ncbi:unnamed protein product [Staurois parvus]|uniref:Prolactin receptor n=1 Tax=Staurois parvus TaxID=386267 RepID=A0ABN9ASX7_9NEOB|nr:unnamed protein product [Staurois parvus]
MSPSSVIPGIPSTQEGHTIPHHHQSGNLRDPKVEVKEEIKEEEDEDWGMEESELLKDIMVESSSYRNPPERCPRPLYSWDSTQEGHTIPHHYKVDGSSHGNPKNREMSPSSLFRPFTQEGHTIPHHHQSGILGDDNIDVKEEYKGG